MATERRWWLLKSGEGRLSRQRPCELDDLVVVVGGIGPFELEFGELCRVVGSEKSVEDSRLHVGDHFGRRHRLDGHVPVRIDAMFGEVRFWLDAGVDGLRLDAVALGLTARRHWQILPKIGLDHVKRGCCTAIIAVQ